MARNGAFNTLMETVPKTRLPEGKDRFDIAMLIVLVTLSFNVRPWNYA